MKKIAMIAAGGLIAMLPSFASARTFFGFRFGWPIVPAPAVIFPAPVVVAPVPVPIAPAPVVVIAPPAPVVIAPAPVYCPPAPYFYFHYTYPHGRPFYRGGWHHGR
jgi:hypothetical protein